MVGFFVELFVHLIAFSGTLAAMFDTFGERMLSRGDTLYEGEFWSMWICWFRFFVSVKK
jgi:hypothetical protein